MHDASGRGDESIDTLWLVAKEPIAAGSELRFDYEEGCSNYWHGQPPRESDWREQKRVIPSTSRPPPSGIRPTIGYLPALLEGRSPLWPELLSDA